LSSGAFLLLFAQIADTFGRRSLLIFSMGAFAISSLIAGFSTNAMYLDVFGGLLGLWSAAAVPPAVGILGAAYERPSKRKNRAFACFALVDPFFFVQLWKGKMAVFKSLPEDERMNNGFQETVAMDDY
jgi:MFS family permease